MTPRDFSELEQALIPYISLLQTAVSFGWDQWQHKYKADRGILSRRSRASIVRDHMVYKATELVSQHPELRCITYRGRYFVVISDKVLVQFKKLNGKRLTSNPVTKQSSSIESQIPLAGMPENAIYVQAGYILDVSESDLAEMCVTYQFGRNVLWFLNLSQIAMPMLTPGDAPSSPLRERRDIRSKAPNSQSVSRESNG